jgi:hypothetical protein
MFRYWIAEQKLLQSKLWFTTVSERTSIFTNFRQIQISMLLKFKLTDTRNSWNLYTLRPPHGIKSRLHTIWPSNLDFGKPPRCLNIYAQSQRCAPHLNILNSVITLILNPSFSYYLQYWYSDISRIFFIQIRFVTNIKTTVSHYICRVILKC